MREGYKPKNCPTVGLKHPRVERLFVFADLQIYFRSKLRHATMTKQAELKLYGDITEWNENSAVNFTTRLEAAQQSGEVLIRMHCYGGSVLEGNVIANAIERNGKTDIQIDGVAASMGAFILPYARRVTIAANSYIMLHAPMFSGMGVTADVLEKEVKIMRSLEANFIAKLKSKTGQPEEVIRTWLVGDNWFSADEAKAVGLVDEIINPVTDVEQLDAGLLKSYTAKGLYDRYSALTETKPITKNNSEMNKTELIARYGLTGVTADSSEADIYAAMDKQIAEAKTAKETAEAALQAEKDKQIDTIVAQAKAAQKITDAQVPNFVAIGKSAGIEALQTALDAIKPMPTITGMLNNNATIIGGNTAEPKTFSELVALGETVLADWKQNRQADYKRLYEAEYKRKL
jgi:ATP-dependent protease ClpP protease subunit